ncbi:MAG TPA: gamma-glutamyl-gamma-aminobutyrate hydrolase family protein [bacterium]|nr:gamma-glutamyl-gamma-aminobutyrate hydrolase family protein [bacterium]
MAKIDVFQHVPHENLGSFERTLAKAGVEVRYIHSYREDLSRLKLSEREGLSGVIVLGGPMSANDAEELPFIREELRLIEEAMRLELPFLGVCLGSQLLAKALGKRVYRGEAKEIGWYPLWMRPEAKQDPLFQDFPAKLEMFQWHGETFELPYGSALLASSQLYLHQAFRYGKAAYGLQFHAEMTPEMIAEWEREGRAEIERAGLQARWENIEVENDRHLPRLRSLGETAMRGFAKLLK